MTLVLILSKKILVSHENHINVLTVVINAANEALGTPIERNRRSIVSSLIRQRKSKAWRHTFICLAEK